MSTDTATQYEISPAIEAEITGLARFRQSIADLITAVSDERRSSPRRIHLPYIEDQLTAVRAALDALSPTHTAVWDLGQACRPLATWAERDWAKPCRSISYPQAAPIRELRDAAREILRGIDRDSGKTHANGRAEILWYP